MKFDEAYKFDDIRRKKWGDTKHVVRRNGCFQLVEGGGNSLVIIETSFYICAEDALADDWEVVEREKVDWNINKEIVKAGVYHSEHSFVIGVEHLKCLKKKILEDVDKRSSVYYSNDGTKKINQDDVIEIIWRRFGF